MAADNMTNRNALVEGGSSIHGQENTSSIEESSDSSGLKLFGGVFISMAVAKLLFAALTLVGEVGQIIMYPLWLDVVESGVLPIGNQTHHVHVPKFDCYAVVLSASVFELLLFFAMYLAFGRRSVIEKSFPHSSLLLVSVCNSANSILTAFTSSGTRTAPYLQTLLLNSYIPFTVGLRYLLLKKSPNRKKAICVTIVTLALLVCLIPNFDARLSGKSSKDVGGPTGAAKFLWPMAFSVAVIPAVLMNVFQERYFKGIDLPEGRDTVDVFYLNLWMSFYQLIFVVLTFWLDLIPGFGTVDSMDDLFDNLRFGFGCFFGQDDCGATPGLRGLLYVVSYVVSYLAGALLIKHGEGSTLWALVVNMVTPLTFLFWTLFDENPFKWDPEVHASVGFSIAGLALMLPATIVYNLGDNNEHQSVVMVSSPRPSERQSETEPLLDSKKRTHYV